MCSPTEEPDTSSNNVCRSEEEDLHYMLSCLNEEELEIAARTNYEYSVKGPGENREKHAMAMARRYLESKKEVERALECMKETIQFRKDINIDRLRTVFDGVTKEEHPNETIIASPTTSSTEEDDGSSSHPDTTGAATDKDTAAAAGTMTATKDFAAELAARLSSKKNFVMGYDKQGRATFHFIPRCTQHHDLEWTLLESVYTMERAIACSQRRSSCDASNSTINAVLDCVGMLQWEHAPPLTVAQEFLKTLRLHYVGHFHRIYILDAPMGFAWLWKMLSPFVGTATRDKIVFLTGPEEKMATLSAQYDAQEAAPWMLEEQGKRDRELDLDEYLYNTPFDQAFDEKTSSS